MLNHPDDWHFLKSRVQCVLGTGGSGPLRYSFGDYEFDEGTHELVNNGERVRVEPQVALLFKLLIQERDRIVSKSEIIEFVWGGRTVSDASIDNRISAARAAIGDSGGEQRLIKTFPTRGFQFVGEVTAESGIEATTPHGETDIPSNSSPLETTANEQKEPRSPGKATLIAATLAILAAFVTITVWFGLFWRETVAESAQARPYDAAVAVLPFREVGAQDTQAYLGEGLADELTNVLARIDGMKVTSSSSAFRFAGSSGETVSEAAEALGVSHIVEGSVAREGDVLKVTVHLIDAVEDDRIRTETFSRPYDISNIIRIQEQIVAAVVAEMLGELAPQSETLPVKTESIKALELYYQAQPLLRDRTASSVLQAIELLKEAVDADPNYVDAYSSLFFAYNSAYFYGELTWNDLQITRDLALEKAAQLDPNDPQVLQAVGMMEMITGDPREAIATLQQSLIREPNRVRTLNIIAGAYGSLGRATEEREFLRKARKLDPLNPRVLDRLARAEFNLGDTQAALEVARTNLRWNEAQPNAQLRLATLLIQVGDYAAGHDLLLSVLKTNPGNYSYARAAADFYMRVGWEAQAEQAAASMPYVKAEMDAVLFRREEVERFLAANPEYDTTGGDQGLMYFFLRDFETALPLMKRAIYELEITGPADLGWTEIYAYVPDAHVLRDAGDPDGDVILKKIEETLSGQTPQTAENYNAFMASAGVEMLKGNQVRAMDWLEAAFEDGHVFLDIMRHPTFAPLSDNPRFQALFDRMEVEAQEYRTQFAR